MRSTITTNQSQSLFSQVHSILSTCYLKVILLGVVGLFGPLSMAAPVSPLVAQDAEREQAERLEQLEQSQQAIKNLTPLPKIESGATPPSSRCFTIENVTFVGNRQFNNDALLAVIDFQSPVCIGINEINEYLRLITNAYIEAGFVTSRAFLVPQDMSDGELTIEVLEGRLEKLLFNGEPAGFLNNAFPNMINQPLNLRDIEQGLDQINRLSRYNAQIKLLPGSDKGLSVVNIQTQTGAFGHLGVGLSNSGQDSTGEEQFAINTGLENGFDALDKWSLNYTKSSEYLSYKDSESLFLSVDIPRGYWNTGFRTSYSNYLSTVSSNGFNFDSTGRTNSFDMDVKWLFHRDSESKSSLKWGVHHRREKNYIMGSLLATGSRNLSSASVSAEHSTHLGSGFLTVSPRFVMGTDWFGGEEDRHKEAFEPKAQFYKGTLTTSYRYPFTSALSVNSTLFAQWSNHTLYGNERLSIGGEYSVRGFKGVSLSGDEGYYWRNELNYILGQWPYIGQVSTQLALDTGSIVKDKQDKLERGSLMGGSFALRTQAKYFSGSLSAGFPIEAPGRLNADDYVVYYRLNVSW